MNSLFFREFKYSFWLALPLMVAFVSEMSMGLVNSAMMGYLGPAALAAGALGVGAFWLFLVVSIGTLSAVGVSISQALGANESAEKVSHYLQQGVYVSLLITVPVMWAIWHASFIFKITGQNFEVSVLANQFLHGIAWIVPAELGFLLLRELTSALEKPTMVMTVALCALPLNAALDYGFIFGVWGLPQWGMFGIGLATSIVQFFMFFTLAAYCLLHTKTRPYVRQRFGKPHIATILHLLRVGLPSGFMLLFEVGLFVVSAFMMGRVGVLVLAAHQVVLQSVEFAFMFVLAVAQISAIRVSRNVGAENLQGAKIAAAANVSLGLIISAFFGLIYMLFPERITDIFINIDNQEHTQLMAYAKQFFLFAMVFVLFDALQAIGNGVLRGLKDTFIPMLLGMGSYWLIGITAGYVLAFKLSLGGVGVWLGLSIGMLVSASILWLRWGYMIRRMLYLGPK